MKYSGNTFVILSTILLSNIRISAQGFFQDLNFERAKITMAPGYSFYILESDALPGWGAGPVNSLNGNLYIGFDSRSLGGPAVFLEDSNALDFSPIQGKYSVLLQGETTDGTPGTAAIWQTGQIPLNAKSLQFSASQLLNFQVTFNNQILPYTAIGSGLNYNIYAADVSTLAGSDGQLTFTALPNGQALLDNIIFSSNSVPEPGTCVLLGCGTALFVIQHKLRKE